MKYLCLSLVLLAAFWACTPEEEKITNDSSAALRFSQDTVFFDTLFTSVGSITQRLKVFNDNDKAVEISKITLNQANSPYTIYINGDEGDAFENVRLLGKDSMLVLVEVTINPSDENLPFIVDDQINFETNNNKQDVKLVSWGQDAHFLRDSVLACNSVWTADKPYVIYNSVLIDSLCSLTIEPGTKIYSHNGSYIFVQGTILANGTAENRILFQNDRLDYKNTPGQWGGIIFLEGSKSNSFNYADIRNAEVGIYLGTPDDDNEADLIVANSTIENIGGVAEIPISGGVVMPGYGVLAITSDLYMCNTLINNCAINALGNYAGGNYQYNHCTFANYSFDFFREDPSVVLADNLVIGQGQLLVDDLNVELVNSIIWGSLRSELVINNGGGAAFSIAMNNNLIRTEDESLDVNGNILNEDPRFINPSDYDFNLDTLSVAKDAGIATTILTDHDGKDRDNTPDLGAFERIEKE